MQILQSNQEPSLLVMERQRTQELKEPKAGVLCHYLGTI